MPDPIDDLVHVRADDALIDRLAAGGAPAPADELAALLAAWADSCRGER